MLAQQDHMLVGRKMSLETVRGFFSMYKDFNDMFKKKQD